MIIIYHCYGGSHSSILAAAIHVKILPQDRQPEIKEMFACPLLEQGSPESHGNIHLIGIDEQGNRVYSMGCKNAFHIINKSLKGIMEIFNLNPQELYFVDTLPCDNNEMRVGSFLSWQLGLTGLGRPLVIKGSQKAFGDLARLVEGVKKDLKVKGVK